MRSRATRLADRVSSNRVFRAYWTHASTADRALGAAWLLVLIAYLIAENWVCAGLVAVILVHRGGFQDLSHEARMLAISVSSWRSYAESLEQQIAKYRFVNHLSVDGRPLEESATSRRGAGEDNQPKEGK